MKVTSSAFEASLSPLSCCEFLSLHHVHWRQIQDMRKQEDPGKQITYFVVDPFCVLSRVKTQTTTLYKTRLDFRHLLALLHPPPPDPPRRDCSGEERGLISQAADGNRVSYETSFWLFVTLFHLPYQPEFLIRSFCIYIRERGFSWLERGGRRRERVTREPRARGRGEDKLKVGEVRKCSFMKWRGCGRGISEPQTFLLVRLYHVNYAGFNWQVQVELKNVPFSKDRDRVTGRTVTTTSPYLQIFNSPVTRLGGFNRASAFPTSNIITYVLLYGRA